ncbi:hypothetical protein ACFP65_07815 [Marinilactibacillus sp. GCM10026970]|uniref:hypothetical protein n=1 Tax=Marinilactibacillus sp. GCM10026970 TaxID=3252642 RepID=UPI00361B3172
MIGHQYLSLEVDCHQQSVIGISGFFDIELCKTGHVSHLNFEENTLAKIVSESLLLECEVGYDYKMIGETIFDPISKRLLVGTIDKNAYKKTSTFSRDIWNQMTY